MSVRSLLRSIVLAVLLLAGQYSALVHSTWHLHDHLAGHVQQADAGDGHGRQDGDDPSGSGLCGLHAALGDLLAGGCGGSPVIVAASPLRSFLIVVPAWFAARTVTLLPPSRAPPVFS